MAKVRAAKAYIARLVVETPLSSQQIARHVTRHKDAFTWASVFTRDLWAFMGPDAIIPREKKKEKRASPPASMHEDGKHEADVRFDGGESKHHSPRLGQHAFRM